MPATLLLARHGQSVWNRGKRVTGQLDPELAPEGRVQARALAKLLHGIELSAIYVSDLARSRETAQLVAASQGLEVGVLPALRELHFGTLQGRFRDARDPEAETLWRARKGDPVGFRAPGGESFAELASRVTPAVREILTAHRSGTVLIVGHRNTNRAILASLLGWTAEMALTTPIGHDRLYRLLLSSPPRVSVIRFHAGSASAEAVRP